VRHTVAVRDPRQPSGPLRPDEIFDDAAIGLAGGVDIPVRITPRLDLIPTVRVHWLFDKDRTQDGVVKRGIRPVFTRLGLGVGVRF
jgi:hypothetical protein